MNRGSIGCKQHRDKIGVLIAQLGTPEAPTAEALKPYLKQFLSDPRVIEDNRLVWWFVLNFIVLQRRPARSAALYKRIWTEEGSPLLVLTERLMEALEPRMKAVSGSIELAYGMRYGEPSLERGIDGLLEKGCTRILLFPMYPQYSAATTGSTYDAVFPHIRARRWMPTLRVAEPFYAHPQFVSAQAQKIREAYAGFERRPERLVLSYHGIPRAYVDKGDPYCCQCTETTEALLPLLDIPKDEVIHTYQSRFGKDPWLAPYTDVVVRDLAKQGIKRVAVACPGFLTDCLETLDEIGNEAEEEFKEHGGEELHLIPCLNASPVWVDAMVGLLCQELGSWLTTVQRQSTQRCPIECPLIPG